MEQIGTFGTSRTHINDLQLFRDETDPDVAAMLADCAIVRLPKGERIDDSGQAHLYIVLSGQLEIESDAHAGDETGTTRVLPGESVGDQAVLDDAANLAAMTPWLSSIA